MLSAEEIANVKGNLERFLDTQDFGLKLDTSKMPAFIQNFIPEDFDPKKLVAQKLAELSSEQTEQILTLAYDIVEQHEEIVSKG